MSQSPNLLLNDLPPNVFAAISPKLRTLHLSFGDTVSELGEPVPHVLFPHDSVVSLVIPLQEGGSIEAAMIGRDGVTNATSALDGNISLHRAIVQVAGSSSAIKPEVLRDIANEFEPLRSMMIRHEQVLLAQAMQSAACNASHTVEERMCRWLLRLRELSQSDQLMLTQEYLAQLLGVKRTTVSMIAGNLQSAGFFRYRRGHIKIVDVEALHEGSCECYEKVRGDYHRLLIG